MKPIEEREIRKASEGDYEKLVKILEYNFQLYKLIVNQVGWRYDRVLKDVDAWFSTAYSLIVRGMGDDKFHKSPVGEVFRKYGEFVEFNKYISHLGIAAMVTTPPQLQPKNSE